MSGVLFVHGVQPVTDGRVSVELERVSNQGYTLEGEGLFSEGFEAKVTRGLREGSFVRLANGEFRSAGGEGEAKAALMLNNKFRSLLESRSEAPSPFARGRGQVCSYHVNVGHGNCSIIVRETGMDLEIVMVDCSTYDFLNHQHYRNNLASCIQTIMADFALGEFSVSRFFLTHPHFDHFNGIGYLLDNGYLENSEIWANMHYSWAMPSYNTILMRLYNSARAQNLKFVEPIAGNSGSFAAVLHPSLRTLRTSPKTSAYCQPYRIVSQVNNSSTVLMFGSERRTMILPGDLEREGWAEFHDCHHYLPRCSYYCVSHHGSATGHFKPNCPHSGGEMAIASCLAGLRCAAIMGRDRAYSGIFSTEVLRDFGASGHRVDAGANANVAVRFIRIDWDTGHVAHYA